MISIFDRDYLLKVLKEALWLFLFLFSKDGTESALINISTGPVEIYVVKRSQRHLLTAIDNN